MKKENKFSEEKDLIIESKNEESRIKSQEINDLVSNFHNQMNLQRCEQEEFKENWRNMEQNINELNSEIKILTNRIQAKSAVISHFRQLTNALIWRIEGLITQKKWMGVFNKIIKDSYQKNYNFLERVYYKIRDLNLDIDSSDSTFSSQQKSVEIKENILPIQSFRKVVIAIIALNRMKRLSQSIIDGFGKYNIDDYDNIEIADYNYDDSNIISKVNNPYCDNSDQYMSFARLQNASESPISITPDKHESKNNSAENIILKPRSLFTSKTCKSLHELKIQSVCKRKRKDKDLFPYISFRNYSKLQSETNLTSQDKSYNSSASQQYYTALTRQLDLQLKTFLEKTRKIKETSKSLEKQNQK